MKNKLIIFSLIGLIVIACIMSAMQPPVLTNTTEKEYVGLLLKSSTECDSICASYPCGSDKYKCMTNYMEGALGKHYISGKSDNHNFIGFQPKGVFTDLEKYCKKNKCNALDFVTFR